MSIEDDLEKKYGPDWRFKTLTEEELAQVPVISKEEFREALYRADAALMQPRPNMPPPKKGRGCVNCQCKRRQEMKVRPLFDRVLVRRSEATKTTKSGILIPEMAQEKPIDGTVVAVGSTTKEVKVGDTILFGKYAGNEVKAGDELLLLIREEEILGVVE